VACKGDHADDWDGGENGENGENGEDVEDVARGRFESLVFVDDMSQEKADDDDTDAKATRVDMDSMALLLPLLMLPSRIVRLSAFMAFQQGSQQWS